MAVRRRSGNYRRTGTARPEYVSDNLARKYRAQELERELDRSGRMDFDRVYRPQPETQADRIARRRAEAKAERRPAMTVSPALVAGSLAVVGMLMLVLLCHVQMNAISSRIVTMKTEINKLQAANVSLQVAYGRAFDLASVKEQAERAGMEQPGESQIYYISLPGEDRAVSYTGREEDKTSGFFARLVEQVEELLAYFATGTAYTN